MNLDRFSQSMPWEWNNRSEMAIDGEMEYVHEIHCACGCGCILDLDDLKDYVVSVVWEETFISNDPQCINRFEENQKRIALQSNPLK